MAANRTDGNFQVQALPDSPLQPQRTTTLSITELELLLRRLGLKVPIPYFEAADVLNKPLDIGRCYLADILNSLIDGNLKKGGAYSSILTPGDVFNGDLAVVLPKLKPGSKPNEVVDSLITKFPLDVPLFNFPFADGIQLRVMFNSQALSRIVLPYIQDRKETYGCDVSPGLVDRKKLVIDFSSPDIAREFQGKHLRSTIIGSFISKLYESMGWDVSKINYLGDWGMPVGLLGVGWERYGSEEQFEADPITHLLEVYNKINKEFISELKESKRIRDRGGDPAELEGQGVFAERKKFFKRLEDGEEKANRFWRRVREVNIANYTKLYASLNISFDEYSGESQVSPAIMTEVEEILKSKGICDNVEGTWLIDLKKHTGRPLGTAIIRNRTGTSSYLLRELAAAIQRYRKYNFDKMIYVVAADLHTIHFPRVFKILELAGMADLASKLQWVDFNGGSQISEQLGEGKGYMLGDILEQYQAAMVNSLEENPDKSILLGDTDREALAAIGTTALLAQELSTRRANKHVFDINQMTSFVEGTGPDLQYRYAKLCSILNLCHATLYLSDKDYASIEDEDHSNLLRYLIQYPDITHTAFKTLESGVIMSYLSSVTSQLSECLSEIEDGTSLTPAQIMLYEVTRRVLENGMKVLGIKLATK
ncbi:Nucleotidylyl transferase [Hyaloscypha variabilis F]|uniref:arginine--tRNA ligase n=1 Tax=Hyaloscypha variabilis (strain UAMH 11265 / GT02V1 / F) TaxID=1149755 RepID=A0A2J6QV48_HYAVF|nr:Nucleotidylyl transferase [Hyaloscypha variabilis F]